MLQRIGGWISKVLEVKFSRKWLVSAFVLWGETRAGKCRLVLEKITKINAERRRDAGLHVAAVQGEGRRYSSSAPRQRFRDFLNDKGAPAGSALAAPPTIAMLLEDFLFRVSSDVACPPYSWNWMGNGHC